MQRFTTALRYVACLLPLLLICGKSTADIALSALAVMFLVHSALTRDWQWLRARWVQLGIALAVYMALRGAFTAEPGHAIGVGLGWIRLPLGAAALSHWLLNDPATRRRLLWVLGATVGFLALDSLIQYIRGVDLLGRPYFTHMNIVRLTGPLSEPRVGIVMTWLVLPVLLGLAAARSRWLMAAAASLMAVVIFLSGERMALLLYVAALGVTFLAQRRFRLPLLAAGVTAGGVAALLILTDPQIYSRQVEQNKTEVGGFANSVYGRTWKAAAQVGRDNLPFGAGYKQFTVQCKTERYGPTDAGNLAQRCPLHPHNLYLAWFADYGLPGLGLFALLAASILRDMYRHRALLKTDALALALALAVLIRLWPLSITPNQFVGWTVAPMWLMIGWFYAHLRANQKN